MRLDMNTPIRLLINGFSLLTLVSVMLIISSGMSASTAYAQISGTPPDPPVYTKDSQLCIRWDAFQQKLVSFDVPEQDNAVRECSTNESSSPSNQFEKIDDPTLVEPDNDLEKELLEVWRDNYFSGERYFQRVQDRFVFFGPILYRCMKENPDTSANKCLVHSIIELREFYAAKITRRAFTTKRATGPARNTFVCQIHVSGEPGNTLIGWMLDDGVLDHLLKPPCNTGGPVK